MLSPQIYYAILFLVSAFAFWRGRRDERIAAAICILATFATHFVYESQRRLRRGRIGRLHRRCRDLLRLYLHRPSIRTVLAALGRRPAAHDGLLSPAEGDPTRPDAAGLCSCGTLLGLSHLPDHRDRDVAEPSPAGVAARDGSPHTHRDGCAVRAARPCRRHVPAKEVASEPRHRQPPALLGKACGRGGARQSRSQSASRLGDARSGRLHAISARRCRSRWPTSPTSAVSFRTTRRTRGW